MRYFLLLFFGEIVVVHSMNMEFLKPSKLQTKIAPEIQKKAAQDAILTYLKEGQYQFIRVAEVNPALFRDEKDVFILTTHDDRSQDGRYIEIRASSGVAAVWGFNYYLKQYCDSHVGWQVTNVRLPHDSRALPYVNETVVANDRFRYYMNVCTPSYSFVWWDSRAWADHIRWMALNGINLALAPLGQEAVWASVYLQLGLTEDEIAEHFTGPAFLSWLRMGNMRGWAGPLSTDWHQRTRDLQTEVLQLMRNLGMIPVLPAFAGHVPRAFARIFPNASFNPMQSWNKFSDKYCCPLFLDPIDPLFKIVAEKFLRESTRVHGTGHIYSADPFNEMQSSGWSTEFVERVGGAIFSGMRAVDPDAVWLLQNWMFVHNPELWPRDRVEAFLRSVPNGRMLILDLQSEQWPQYNYYDMYFGQPFVWCMLHNFGGTLGMFGNMETINREVYAARAHSGSTMVGVGLTMEGINQNYVVYDLMLESAWRKHPVDDMDEWVAAYARRRYSCVSVARGWRYLLRSVYNFRGLNRMRGKYVVTRRPSLELKPWAWYGSEDLMEVWKEFVRADAECGGDGRGGFLHDLVDVTRQALQYRAEQLYLKLTSDLRYGDIYVTRITIDMFLDAMKDMEAILATHKDFWLYNWLDMAKRSSGPGDATLNDLNARNQITLWGPNGEISDYACKQWAEMFKHYYSPRWRMFLEAMYQASVKNQYFNEKLAQGIIRDAVELKFASTEITLPDTVNDTRDAARVLYEKWSVVPDLEDLPWSVIYPQPGRRSTLPDTDESRLTFLAPSVQMLYSTTPLT